MIYYEDEKITIRSMNESDIRIIYEEFLSQNWHPAIETFQKYFQEQVSNQRFVFVAEYEGNVAGFTILISNTQYGPFANKNIPEIVDLNVFQKYRKKGIASKLLDVA